VVLARFGSGVLVPVLRIAKLSYQVPVPPMVPVPGTVPDTLKEKA